MSKVAPREAARRLTHMGVGVLAPLLRFLSWPAALACCVAGIALNHLVLPRASPGLFRAGESRFAGIRAYPLAVLLLVLVFPMRVAAGAWAILAFGDAMAALAGRKWGRAKLPWNREKSWVGFGAFVTVGTLAGLLAYRFVEARPDPAFGLFAEARAWLDVRPWVGLNDEEPRGWPTPAWHLVATLGACATAATFGAVAESLRARLDDNFRIALAAGTALFLLDPLRPFAAAPG